MQGGFIMEKKLYDLLDWAVIEELIYSESSDPHRALGPHMTEEGLLVQALIPTAKSVSVKLADGTYDVKIAWLFEVTESGTDSDTGKEYEYTQYMFVDAADGTEVLF